MSHLLRRHWCSYWCQLVPVAFASPKRQRLLHHFHHCSVMQSYPVHLSPLAPLLPVPAPPSVLMRMPPRCWCRCWLRLWRLHGYWWCGGRHHCRRHHHMNGFFRRKQRLDKSRRLERPPPSHAGVHVFQEVVCMACCHAHEVHHWAAAQHQAECQQHPGQVGRSEVEDTQEVEVDVLVAPAPHVYHHERQAAAQELDVDKGSDGG
mmetsp:Transcript_31121/g.69163  ORF Transcript_31121/g.69163 Transcript_31121/m.69163 type:complete len:205 (+) Transcript_31121:282-896(+)